MKRAIILFVLSLVLTSCEQEITRNFGGTTTIKLEPNQRLIEATWKDADLWYLVEPMPVDYKPTTKYFVESSTYGILEGKVIFIESKEE